MDKIEVLEEKIQSAARTMQALREKNLKLLEEYEKLREENAMLLSENRQVHKLMVELDRFRDERKTVRQKCERLLANLSFKGGNHD